LLLFISTIFKVSLISKFKKIVCMSEIAPVSLVDDYYREGSLFGELKGTRTPVDSKIQFVVLSQIHRSSPSTLLASATSPRVVIDLISGSALPTHSFHRKREKRTRPQFKRAHGGSLIPIGLARCDSYPPLNAILQLLLFIPAFRDVFSFAPHSFLRLAEFIDQYGADQEKKLLTSAADLGQLLRLLIQKMPANFFRLPYGKVDIKDFLCSLIKTVFGQMSTPIFRFLVLSICR
jgi:hypothetical protein